MDDRSDNAFDSAPDNGHATLQFGAVVVDVDRRELQIDGRRVALGPRAFALLHLLVRNRERPVPKNDIMQNVWGDVIVEENNLQVQISHLRRLLGPQAITTVPGRGYRFMLRSSADAVAAAAPPPDEPRSPPWQPQGNLPFSLPPLFGRQRDLDDLVRLGREHKLVTLLGSSGIGKTSLALAVAQAASGYCPDGIWVVELATLNDPALLAPTIAQTLRLAMPGLRAPSVELAAALRSQRMLLVLDNCEHLIDAVGALTSAVLGETSGLRVLATSQEPLHLPGEHQYRLSPLALPAAADHAPRDAPGNPHGLDVLDMLAYGAIELFVERARSLQPGFALTADNSADIVAICQHLDGLPLAIELAAARVPLLGVAGVRQRLGERFRVLTGGSRVAPRRHQTLRAALDWSHSLLSDDERVVYRRLGVFVGSFSLASAQALVADDTTADTTTVGTTTAGTTTAPSATTIDEWSALDHLASLVDKSLVMAEGAPEPRYRMLESTREHALEQLAATAETDVWLARHAQVTVAALRQGIRSRRTDLVLAETANVRSAYEWARGHPERAETAVAMATLPSMVLAVDGAVAEARRRLLEVEPLVQDPLPTWLQAQYWQWLGRCGHDGRLPAARCIDAFERAERMFATLGNQRHVHGVCRQLAEACIAAGDIDRAQAAITRARAMEDDTWPLADRLRRLRVDGLLLAKRGKLPDALKVSQQALAMAQFGQIGRYELVLLGDIAHMHLEAGNVREAAERYRTLAERARHSPHAGLTLSQTLADWIVALTADDRLDDASALAREALPVLRRSGILVTRAEVLAYLLARQGEWRGAARLLGASEHYRAQAGFARDTIARQCWDRALALLTDGVGAANRDTWLAEGAQATEDSLADALLDAGSAPGRGVMR